MKFSQTIGNQVTDPDRCERPATSHRDARKPVALGIRGGHPSSENPESPREAAIRWGGSSQEYLLSRWRRPAEAATDSTVRVVVGQPDEPTAAGIAALLNSMPGILVVGVATEKSELFRHVKRERPDVVVSELMFDSSKPYRGLERAMRNLAGIPLVVLTAHQSDPALRLAVKSGVSAFVGRQEQSVKLEIAIRNAAASGSYFGLNIIQRLIRMNPDEPGAPAASAARLTGRQTEVVALANEGLSIPEIGIRLGLRPKTVAAHMDRIRGKVGPGSMPTKRRLSRTSAGTRATTAVG